MKKSGFWAHGSKQLREGLAGDPPEREACGQGGAPGDSQGKPSRGNALDPATEQAGEGGIEDADEVYQPTKEEIAKSLF